MVTLERALLLDPQVMWAGSCRVGNKDQAFAWFERAVDDRSSLPPLYHNDARWDKLRSDPRWASLIKRIGLPNP